MKRFKANEIIYDSKSEAAISLLLQKYCPFIPCEGETLHMPTERTTIDFIVEDVLVEWHPSEKRESNKVYSVRKSNLLKDSQFENCELIIISNLRELYERVLRRFGKDVPEYEKIAGEFGSIRQSIRRI